MYEWKDHTSRKELRHIPKEILTSEPEERRAGHSILRWEDQYSVQDDGTR
jgi:hypothetical protein